ncbi:MAG: thiamine-phosphate kinase [Thermoplasmatota archaeon]
MRLDDIEEIKRIDRLTGGLPTSELLVNRIHSSDSEILDIGIPGHYLALTTDTIVEEVASGLYDDPYQIGWMVVAASMSDLAAVGAEPLGILLSHTIPDEWGPEDRNLFRKGILSSCLEHGCPVLGGDLNSGSASFTGTGVGKVERSRVMSRIGCSRGDILYTTGPAGLGTAYAIGKMVLKESVKVTEFLPKARIREGRLISGFASSCMDTSDGLISALDHLSRINEVPIRLDPGLLPITEEVERMADSLSIPPAAFTFSIHGDFELIFSIPAEKEASFITSARRSGIDPIKIGVFPEDGVEEGVYFGEKRLHTTVIRNLWDNSSDPGDYASNLLRLITKYFR